MRGEKIALGQEVSTLINSFLKIAQQLILSGCDFHLLTNVFRGSKVLKNTMCMLVLDRDLTGCL